MDVCKKTKKTIQYFFTIFQSKPKWWIDRKTDRLCQSLFLWLKLKSNCLCNVLFHYQPLLEGLLQMIFSSFVDGSDQLGRCGRFKGHNITSSNHWLSPILSQNPPGSTGDILNIIRLLIQIKPAEKKYTLHYINLGIAWFYFYFFDYDFGGSILLFIVLKTWIVTTMASGHHNLSGVTDISGLHDSL